MSELNVIIIGAGIGVRVYERDRSPWDRSQGYRLHLDADALNATREVLPERLHDLFDATAFHTEPYTTILGTNLSVIKRLLTQDEHGEVWPAQEGPPIHANVDRATLRQILLIGLDDVVQYGKSLERYEVTTDGVVAHFTDGTSATGDVLVGADGIRSRVRSQRAPAAQTVDAGIIAVYGRVSMEKAVALVPAEALEDIFTIASDDRKAFLGLGAVRFPSPPDQAAAQFAPGASMKPQDDYLVCIVGGRPDFWPVEKAALRASSGAKLQAFAVEVLKAWPGEAAAVVRAGDPAAFFPVDMYTSVPCMLDAPGRVTLLGDAIHAMTPTLGRGANVAMRDGALLGRALRSVAGAAAPLDQALAAYGREMLDYSFAVVREAAKVGQQRMAQNPLLSASCVS